MSTIIAHRSRLRGENHKFPGNTLAAFDQLVRHVPNISVEFDVHYTAGGLLVVTHDDYLPEFTDRTSGWIQDITSVAELRALRIKVGGAVTEHAPPQLAEVLDLLNGRLEGTCHLEVKSGPHALPGIIETLLPVLQGFPKMKIAISSFDQGLLSQVPSKIPIGILTNSMPAKGIVADALQFTTNGRPLSQVAFHPDVRNLTIAQVRAARACDMEINAYTVPAHLFSWCREHQVNMITDHPIAAIEFLASAS